MPSQVSPSPFIIRPAEDIFDQNPALRRLNLNLSNKFLFHEAITDEDLQVFGSGLWNVLGVQETFDGVYEKAGASILPIIIESDSASIQSLPWEIVYHPVHGFLGKNLAFTITRTTNL